MLHDIFASVLDANHVRDRAELVWQSCYGRCTQGPNVLVREILTAEPNSLGSGFATMPGPRGATALYNRVDQTRVERIVAEHVVGGRIVRELIESPTATGIPSSVPVASKTKEPEQ